MTADIPLATRLRPQKIEDVVGQDHLLGPSGAIKQMLDNNILPSIIFWGPPGVGKTTLAKIIAHSSQREFRILNAISSGVKEVRETIDWAKGNSFMGQREKPIVFIDEIHRFNKGQQDALLHAVEQGIICLIGATTENPGFEVNSALMSRCQLYILKPLNDGGLRQLLHKALEQDEWLRSKEIVIESDELLISLCGGDARKLFNYLEIFIISESNQKSIIINNEKVSQHLGGNILRYDKSGEQHYDIISAFIKSIRGSDPDAGLYWLARMLNSGEDPSFIARRLVILASEDIGNANPNALLLAMTSFDAVKAIGMPEAEIILSQVTCYLATSPKSNSSYIALKNVKETINQTGALSVPIPLRNAPIKLMKDIGYGATYLYPHDYPNNFVSQNYLPDALLGSKWYFPGESQKEESIKMFLHERWGKCE
jgi:putative ATPase